MLLMEHPLCSTHWARSLTDIISFNATTVLQREFMALTLKKEKSRFRKASNLLQAAQVVGDKEEL